MLFVFGFELVRFSFLTKFKIKLLAVELLLIVLKRLSYVFVTTVFRLMRWNAQCDLVLLHNLKQSEFKSLKT